MNIFLQDEDEYTYNFKWYTSYACPERPHECVVTDPKTLQQYDLSRLALSQTHVLEKYFILVCWFVEFFYLTLFLF